ncbi:MAG: SUMF1/EgtB/PvdO family nonheme iron enzyme [Candidatus Kapabacteria bacterium]|nr:SUMF1/EgtB/PvdO family nonheme iron enzyme [Candidatus Kapabacteria bacterium]
MTIKKILFNLFLITQILIIYSCSEKENPINQNEDPVLNSIVPNKGIIGQAITLEGKNFGDARGNSFVDFNGSKPGFMDYISWTSTTIKLYVPMGTTTGKVYVNVNGKISNSLDFEIIDPSADAPFIDSIDVKEAEIGASIVIFGRNFLNSRGNSYVEFNGVKAFNYFEWADNRIVVKIPNGASTGKVVVWVEGKSSNGVDLIIGINPPLIENLNTSNASIGDIITVNGRNFGANRDTSYVEFNGVKATEYSQWSENIIKVKVPPGATTGKVFVVVGKRKSNGVDLVIKEAEEAPQIDLVDNNKPRIGDNITITGKRFGSVQGASYVQFKDTKATEYSLWSDTKITVKVPAGAESGNMFVVVGNKQSNFINITITPFEGDPQISYLDNSRAQIGTAIGIYGTNFGDSRGSSYVDFGGQRAWDYPQWTNTKIVVKVPEGSLVGKTIKVTVVVNNKISNSKDFTVQGSFQLLPLALVPAGSFIMGGTDENNPKHKVTISKPFFISKFEVNQLQWKTIMDNSNPSHTFELGDYKPVNQVTFLRAVEFCNKLSITEKLTPCYTINGEEVTCDFNANGYRLPTEAEWEYAARAGKTDFTEDEILLMGWFSINSNKHSQECGQLKANEWGIYDMFGNVYEWCWDFYDEDYYTFSPEVDPRGPEPVSNHRVIRGGCFENDPSKGHPAKRYSFPSTGDNFNYNLGFRVVRNK